MNYILYKNQNTFVLIDNDINNSSFFLSKKKEDVLVPDIITLFRNKYNKLTLKNTHLEILEIIKKQRLIVQNSIRFLAKPSDVNLPLNQINLHQMIYNKDENYILNEKIRVIFNKPTSDLNDVELYIYKLLYENDFDVRDLDDGVDYIDFLFDPLDYYLAKLKWFEYRINHLFHLLLTDDKILFSNYHLDFIVFFIQFPYHVFCHYYDYYRLSDLTKRYDLKQALSITNKKLGNLFNVDNYNLYNKTNNLFLSTINTIRKLEIESNKNGLVHFKISIWPDSIFYYSMGNYPVFLKQEKKENISVCDYTLETISLSYLHHFVSTFLHLSLNSINFNYLEGGMECVYDRVFADSDNYIYFTRKDKKFIYNFDPIQAYDGEKINIAQEIVIK